MRGPEGGFYSALDADSEGVEGRYYVWTLDELRTTLGDAEGLADAAIAFFGATEAGNFEGTNVLEGRGPEPDMEALAEMRARLYAVRETRVRPGTDDKRLCSWNALMISALAEAGAALEREDWLAAAVACAEFVLGEMRDYSDPSRPLQRTFKDGRAHIAAYLEDHAYLLEALLTLYGATGDPRWFAEAETLAGELVARFADPQRGGFFTTAADQATGFPRRPDLDDAPTPSGNSAAAFGLLRLARLTGERAWEDRALGVLAIVAPVVARHPLGFGHALQALDFALARVHEGRDRRLRCRRRCAGRHRSGRLPAPSRARHRRRPVRRRRAAAARPPARRGAHHRLRVRGLCLPRAADRARRARRGPGLKARRSSGSARVLRVAGGGQRTGR